MKIDLKNPGGFTKEKLKELMRSVDDSYHTQYRITKDGFLILIKWEIEKQNLENCLFRLEVNCPHNGYAGLEAAANRSWVNRVFDIIKKNYPNPKGPFCDCF